MKSGIGSVYRGRAGGVRVSSLVAVNAFGDVRDPATGKIDRRRAASSADGGTRRLGSADESAARRGASSATIRLWRWLPPMQAYESGCHQTGATGQPGNGAHHLSGEHDVRWRYRVRAFDGSAQADINTLGVMAAEAVGQAVVRAVRLAPTLGGIPGLAGSPERAH